MTSFIQSLVCFNDCNPFYSSSTDKQIFSIPCSFEVAAVISSVQLCEPLSNKCVVRDIILAVSNCSCFRSFSGVITYTPRTSCNALCCLSVCLFVCLLATLRKNYWTDRHENVTTDVSVHKEELIKFWKSSASGSGSRNFFKDSSALQDRAFFHNLAYISGRVIGFSWKFYHRSILGQASHR